MKVLIYDNKEKDVGGVWLKKLVSCLNQNSVQYEKLEDEDLKNDYIADALFSLGGDGTILFLTEFASRNSIPIIGINTGKLGFLTEFEKNDIEQAVNSLIKNQFILDKRTTLKVTFKGNSYYALNDIFLHHVYTEHVGNLITDIDIKINNDKVHVLKGDGVIVSTPTGSTAYSLSAGGPILAPDLDVFVITPIAAHTLNQRPIVYSAETESKIGIIGAARAGIFLDGKSIGILTKGDYFTVNKGENPVIFFRKPTFDFFKRLSEKLKNNSDGE